MAKNNETKIFIKNGEYHCDSCNATIQMAKDRKIDICPNCGKKINWSLTITNFDKHDCSTCFYSSGSVETCKLKSSVCYTDHKKYRDTEFATK